MNQSTARSAPGLPIVTVALIGTGALLASTGLTMLFAGFNKSAALYKAWKVVGVGVNGVGTLHQVAAIGFIGAAGVHIARNRTIIGRHLKSLGEQVAATPAPATAPAQEA